MTPLRSNLKHLVLAVVLAGVPQASGQEPQNCENTKLCIGVRHKARPFAYQTENMNEVASDAPRGPLRKKGYTGYMVKICDAVLAEMTINTGDPELADTDIGIFDIDEAREKAQKNASCNASQIGSQDCFPATITRFKGGLGEKFDILCDPATISNDRRDNGYMISPPLFLTGIAHLSQHNSEGPRDPCQDTSGDKEGLIGVVGGTTAGARGIRALVDADELPRYREKLISYLRDQRPCGENTNNDKFHMIRSYSDHPAAAKAFCEKKVHYYLGDLEMIIENVRSIPGCEFRVSPTTYTNDRYGIFGKPRGKDPVRALLVFRFFQLLAQKTIINPSLVDKAFSDTFQNADPSRKLELFFWSIRGERD